jgi:hypothetical protein
MRYIPCHNLQRSCARPWAMLARGTDTSGGHYELLEGPAAGVGAFAPEDVARIHDLVDDNNNAPSLYAAKFRR